MPPFSLLFFSSLLLACLRHSRLPLEVDPLLDAGHEPGGRVGGGRVPAAGDRDARRVLKGERERSRFSSTVGLVVEIALGRYVN